MFSAKFRTVTAYQVGDWMRRVGLVRIMRRDWTDDMNAYLCQIIPGHTETQIIDLFYQRYNTKISVNDVANRKAALGVKSGTRGGDFKKGQVSRNKGKTWDEIMSKEAQDRCRKTCFKKGCVPANAKAIGEERINGRYIEVRVPRDYESGPADHWIRKHHLVWEQANGRKVPDNCNVIFCDGDKNNFDPDNLMVVPRALWAIIVRKKIPFHDRETLQIAVDIAKLSSAAYKADCSPRHCRQCHVEFVPRYPNQKTCDGCLGRCEGGKHGRK